MHLDIVLADFDGILELTCMYVLRMVTFELFLTIGLPLSSNFG